MQQVSVKSNDINNKVKKNYRKNKNPSRHVANIIDTILAHLTKHCVKICWCLVVLFVAFLGYGVLCYFHYIKIDGVDPAIPFEDFKDLCSFIFTHFVAIVTGWLIRFFKSDTKYH